MKKLFITVWFTVLCFLMLGDVHAWDVPACLRINGGSRMWFTTIGGDLVQNDQTKVGLNSNIGLQRDQLAWEFFTGLRFDNIHVLRFRMEPSTTYDQSKGDSFLRVRDYRVGYDLDFFMTPQLLFGANFDLEIFHGETFVRDVQVARMRFNYRDATTKVVPEIGFHATFYPILQEIALRPNLTSRVNWMSYEGLDTVDCEVGTGVDVPLNRLWTWSVTGGYRYQHMRFKRDRDTLDLDRSGFFLETSILF